MLVFLPENEFCDARKETSDDAPFGVTEALP